MARTNGVGSGAVRRPAGALGLGALLGVVLLHPITMAVYWMELRAGNTAGASTLWQLVGERMAASFTPAMLP